MLVSILIACVLALTAFFLFLYRRWKARTIGEELVIRVVVEQIAKEKRHTDGNLASYDKNQRRLACMQRFERYAIDHKIRLPVNLLARINAQLVVKGM